MHSVLKGRLDGTEMGSSEIGQEHYIIAWERHVARVNYICGSRNSREEMDSGDLRK